MKVMLAKHGRGFLPGDAQAERLHARLGAGELVQVRVMRARSVAMNNRYWAICTDIARNQEPMRTKESVSDELKVLAGHFEPMQLRLPGGDKVMVCRPKSIAFDELTQDEWMELWPSLEQAGIERFGAEYWLECAVA